jgi:ribosomal protein L31E
MPQTPLWNRAGSPASIVRQFVALHIAACMAMMADALEKFPVFEIISAREMREADNRGGF